MSWFQTGGKRWFATAIVNFLTKMHAEIDVNASLPGKKDADAKSDVNISEVMLIVQVCLNNFMGFSSLQQ